MFTQKQPNAKYTFDSERGAPQSEICREEGPQGRECMMVRVPEQVVFCLSDVESGFAPGVQIQMYSTKLFEAMQVCPILLSVCKSVYLKDPLRNKDSYVLCPWILLGHIWNVHPSLNNNI